MSVALAPKPPHLSFSPSALHRRHPSAPVVVQPTRTPGLLAIKPPRTTPARALPAAQRHAKAAKPAKANQVVRAASLVSMQPMAAQLQAPSTPSPAAARGRAHAKTHKAPVYRSASSTSSVRGKHGRQPSPPINTVTITTQVPLHPAPSQAEVPVISSNLFDPFSAASPPPSPTLAKPSGRLARRRQMQQAEAPALARPIPAAKPLSYPALSRSDPLPSHMRRAFPVCDDQRSEPPSPPATPTRPAHTHTHAPPRTAPLTARAPFGFPFAKGDVSSPPRTTLKRHHRRVPSEGVFAMSSDEDVSSGPGGVVLSRTLFAPLPVTPRAAVGGARSVDTGVPLTAEQRTAREKAGYFASSMFQNSPSPEELPDPLLL
ncbi:hypothetical protein HYPSUDRAFT_207756 [Hypholoma sublateritium FD-334 SS-4]|uniref:Uncharacterized protein n=1 Tax=Hypholoma sublateritium (strain FD-334 SS-4) TaxID=945553 RepID=A0A0D2LXK1_HYPSF|nr:hypothetical protein HYPSUDRAFT_207756 [Hypholoma sublateritium FD-334 SS-4]